MEENQIGNAPSHCPTCGGDLLVTRLECAACGTEVNGTFTLGRLATLREPYASLIEMFLRVRGNVKEMERELGLSYPTVRARLDEALTAAGFPREDARPMEDTSWETTFGEDLAERIQARIDQSLARIDRMRGVNPSGARGPAEAGQTRARNAAAAMREQATAAQRRAILDRLDRGEIAADEAATLLRELKTGR